MDRYEEQKAAERLDDEAAYEYPEKTAAELMATKTCESKMVAPWKYGNYGIKLRQSLFKMLPGFTADTRYYCIDNDNKGNPDASAELGMFDTDPNPSQFLPAGHMCHEAPGSCCAPLKCVQASKYTNTKFCQ